MNQPFDISLMYGEIFTQSFQPDQAYWNYKHDNIEFAKRILIYNDKSID